ncbi:hypothetical protein OG453_00215 [Streptomyces sp. NBC_01381]|uniref:hypothetical protein n=1 Tax=unclassified Streptomyces TaxID=2593676 RepID=UPI00224E0DDF|nr:hypothetical protein [Streptomyces sp. NBC_01381]MCX4665109.1 hypothetical protein [Streptomyces sp. NBC_01381]
MRYADTMDGLSPALTALRVLSVDFPEMPAPTVRVTPIYPTVLDLALHDDLGAFEPWRIALRIAREDIDFHTQSDGRTWVLCASTDYAGARVKLIAYGDVLRRPLTVVGGCDAA